MVVAKDEHTAQIATGMGLDFCSVSAVPAPVGSVDGRAQRVREHLPPNAIVASMAASGALFYYTDLPILRWDSLPPEVFESYAATLQRAGRPLYALLFDLEEKEAFKDHLRGHWEKVVDVRTSSVWKWTGP